ncbi:MAG TPA: hypothetical protein VNA04_15940 [Thermoanaerobaculia bacterium]|nr:hypothetical protein [Thermoanaerobaculia bacterium]
MSLREDLLRRYPRLAALPPGCWVVGGAIRDLLLGLSPADVDVSCLDPAAAAARTGSKPIRLGTTDHLSAWRVVDGGHLYDFAALLDGEIGADLARRDFTVNAMAVALADGRFLDPHGGEADLRRRLVRMVDPGNFDDDPLRCLKGVRMAVRFDFEVEEATLHAIRERAASITSVAPERVSYELSVIFSAARFRRAVDLLRRTGLDVPLFGRTFDAASFAADDVSLAGAMAILVSEPKPFARRWRWSAGLLREVVSLRQLMAMEGDRRMALYDAGEAVARQLPAVLRALERDDRVELPDFSIRPMLAGEEIGALTGLGPGPELGRIKRALLGAQIRGEVRSREEAEALVRSAAGPSAKPRAQT